MSTLEGHRALMCRSVSSRGWTALLVPLLLAASVTLACGGQKSKSRSESELPEGPASELDDEEQAATAPNPADPTREPRPEGVIYRSELARATHGGRPGYLLGQLQPEPYRPRGSREGWVITTVFPKDPDLCMPGCDLFPGDVLLTVNGSPLERPEQLSALMEKLATADKLDVRLVRDGKLHERSYAIVDEAN